MSSLRPCFAAGDRRGRAHERGRAWSVHRQASASDIRRRQSGIAIISRILGSARERQENIGAFGGLLPGLREHEDGPAVVLASGMYEPEFQKRLDISRFEFYCRLQGALGTLVMLRAGSGTAKVVKNLIIIRPG